MSNYEAQLAALTIDIHKLVQAGGLECMLLPDGITQLCKFIAEGLLDEGWTHPLAEAS